MNKSTDQSKSGRYNAISWHHEWRGKKNKKIKKIFDLSASLSPSLSLSLAIESVEIVSCSFCLRPDSEDVAEGLGRHIWHEWHDLRWMAWFDINDMIWNEWHNLTKWHDLTWFDMNDMIWHEWHNCNDLIPLNLQWKPKAQLGHLRVIIQLGASYLVNIEHWIKSFSTPELKSW
jgi:hypothetical protein